MRKLKMQNFFQRLAIFLVLAISTNLAFAQSKKVAPKEPAPNCFISEFRHIGMSIHDPLDRAKQAQQWLVQNVSACTVEKLSLVNANRGAWLGTSDSSHLMTTLETMIEYKSAGKPEMLAQIFNSLGKEGTSSVQVTNVTRSPRVQQAQSAYDTQQYQQQYQQQYEQQAITQAQQQPVNPQAAYPQPTQ
jgi:hypothetical protein